MEETTAWQPKFRYICFSYNTTAAAVLYVVFLAR